MIVIVAVIAFGISSVFAGDVSFPRSTLTVSTADAHKYAYHIEVATTPEQMELGLMNRPSLPEDAGMLFVNKRPEAISMWMKNTMIPLDMLFIGDDGRIINISANATPYSLAEIKSNGAALAVLEINGGQAAAHNIKKGDLIASPALSKN